MRADFNEAVEIAAGPVPLPGDLEIPGNARGLVLFAHGSGSSRRSPRNRFVAQALREEGSGTLLFDLLTRGEEAEDAHTGHLRFNIEMLAGRLAASTEWVRLHPVARDFPLGFFGSSTGGAAALLAAARLGATVRAVVSRGGRPDLVMDALPYVTAPTLLIVGEFDDVVMELNRKALARLTCEKELAVVPGAAHLFEEPGALDEVAERAAHWFREHWPGPADGRRAPVPEIS